MDPVWVIAEEEFSPVNVSAAAIGIVPQKPAAPILPADGLPDFVHDAGAISAVDTILDLSGSRNGLIGALGDLSPEEAESLGTLLASLIQQGVVGVETLDVRGERYTSFITNRLAPSDAQHARPYRSGIEPRSRLDLRA